MSTHTSSRRQARDSNCSAGDPNAPSSRILDGSSVAVHSRVTRGSSVPVDLPHGRPARRRHGPPMPQANSGLLGSPIDVEAIDNEVLMLSSSRDFPQARNQPRRNHPVILVVDEDMEVNPAQPGVSTEDSVATFSRASYNTRERTPSNRTVINCETYSNLKDDGDTKRKSVVKSHPEPEKVVVPKEPLTFNCPVCMNPLVDAASTICGHVFCQGCITVSILARKKCPICTRKLTMSNFHRVYLPSTD